jgi:hypothetical protein
MAITHINFMKVNQTTDWTILEREMQDYLKALEPDAEFLCINHDSIYYYKGKGSDRNQWNTPLPFTSVDNHSLLEKMERHVKSMPNHTVILSFQTKNRVFLLSKDHNDTVHCFNQVIYGKAAYDLLKTQIWQLTAEDKQLLSDYVKAKTGWTPRYVLSIYADKFSWLHPLSGERMEMELPDKSATLKFEISDKQAKSGVMSTKDFNSFNEGITSSSDYVSDRPFDYQPVDRSEVDPSYLHSKTSTTRVNIDGKLYEVVVTTVLRPVKEG